MPKLLGYRVRGGTWHAYANERDIKEGLMPFTDCVLSYVTPFGDLTQNKAEAKLYSVDDKASAKYMRAKMRTNNSVIMNWEVQHVWEGED